MTNWIKVEKNHFLKFDQYQNPQIPSMVMSTHWLILRRPEDLWSQSKIDKLSPFFWLNSYLKILWKSTFNCFSKLPCTLKCHLNYSKVLGSSSSRKGSQRASERVAYIWVMKSAVAGIPVKKTSESLNITEGTDFLHQSPYSFGIYRRTITRALIFSADFWKLTIFHWQVLYNVCQESVSFRHVISWIFGVKL